MTFAFRAARGAPTGSRRRRKRREPAPSTTNAAPANVNERNFNAALRTARYVTSIVLLVALASGPGRAGENWTQFRLNAASNPVLPGTLSTSWSFESGFQISASPAVADNAVYLGNNAGRFFALDARDGRLLWSRQMRSSMKSQPLVWNDLVIAGEGDEVGTVIRGVVHLGSGENALVAFERATGRIRWRALLQGSGMSAPAIVAGTLVHADSDGNVVGIDPSTGHVLYARRIGTIASMSVARPIGGGAFIVGGQTQTQVVALRASDGAVLWRHGFPNGSGIGDCPPASDGARVFCNYERPIPPHPYVKAHEVNEQRAYALFANSGALAWDVALERGVVPVRNQTAIPLVDRGAVFMGSALVPYVHAMDAATGQLRWRTRVRGPVKGGIVAAGGVLYCGDLTGYLWAIDERTGRIIGAMNERTPFNVGSPLIDGRTLIVGSGKGRVVAVPLRTLREGRHARDGRRNR